ncbi:MAG: sugar ABC transporter ATP-binding protein [Acidobacteriota bacterium]
MHKAFGPTVALAGVDLAVAAGEIHAVVGENGAGKSTLMKVLSGAWRPDRGHILLRGKPYQPRDPQDARRHGVAMVYQELSLAPHLSVEDNVLLGMEPTGALGILRRREIRRRVKEALERLGHEEIRPEARVGDLPPAVRQLVEIGRALAQASCQVLILDEPTSSLAGDDVHRLFELIRRLAARGLAILYISHFLEEVRRVAHRVTVLRDGRTVGSGPVSEVSTSKIVRMMVGREMGELFPRSRRTAGETVLAVDGLAGRERPRSATLELRRGEVVGIAGLVGAGRTELLRALFGLDPVRHGTVRVGLFRGPASPTERLGQGVGLLSEDRAGEGLASSLSLADNLTLSRLTGLGPGPLVLPSRQERACQSHIEALEIRCRDPKQPVGELSGGNQQKVALARLLHHDVDVFLLDEPTRGIDVASKARIYRLIDELASAGKAVLMVSSYLPELLGVCDRVAVMCRGLLGPARPASELDEHRLLIEATGQRQ